jgi:hypothetical protein
VLLLLIASAVSASPTIISDGSIPVASPSADRANDIVSYVPGSIEFSSQISELSRTLLQPPQANNQTTQEGNNHYIPVLPPAIGMVLTGFMCVSLFRDRKSWLAVMAFLFAAGQTGIAALPELTSRLVRKAQNSRQIDATLSVSYTLASGYYPESFNSQTQYAGLLHHLAGIPRKTSVFTNKRISLSRLYLGTAGYNTRASQHAIVPALSSLSTAYNYLVRPNRQFICFTPAFIFNLIPRGPPICA